MLGKGAGHKTALRLKVKERLDEARQASVLEKAQPSTVITRLCKVAVKVVEYKDRIKLYLPCGCPFKKLLEHVTEFFYLTPQPR